MVSAFVLKCVVKGGGVWSNSGRLLEVQRRDGFFSENA